MANNSTFKYELNLHPPKGLNLKEMFSDVMYAMIVRNPPIRLGTFVVIRINLPLLIIKQIENDVNDSKFSLKYHWLMDIWQIDETDGRDNRKFKLIFRKPYSILAIKIYNSSDMNVAPKHHVQLTMANPLIHEMSTTNDYNKILQNTTALDALKDYETNLKAKHGDAFKFNRIGSKLNLNNFKYEQLFIPTSVDTLHIPQYIINTYKPYDSFSYYFFDDFHFQSNANRNITCHHINLFDKSVFKKFDVTKYADSSELTHELGRFELNDTGLEVNKTLSDTTPNFRGREIKTDDFKRIKSKVLVHKTSGSTSDQHIDGRAIQTIQKTNTSVKTIGSSSQQFSTYVPDKTTKGESRIIKIKETLTKKLDRIFYFEAMDALIDFPTFGKIYNMELDNQTSYTYTPLSVVNIFKRVSEKDEVLVHNPRFSMIRFIEDADASAEKNEKAAEELFVAEPSYSQLKTKKKKTVNVKRKSTKKYIIESEGVLTTNKPKIIPTNIDEVIMPESKVSGYRLEFDKTIGIIELYQLWSGKNPEQFAYASDEEYTKFQTIVRERSKRQAVIKKAGKV